MKPRISMITLGVSDLSRSIRFYEEGLGFPRVPMEADVAFFTLNGTWLALYPSDLLAEDALVAPGAPVPPGRQGFRGFALAHNVASREEVDLVMQTASAAGARILKPAQDVFWGGYSGYFADPDGFLWEVAWNPAMWVGPKDD